MKDLKDRTDELLAGWAEAGICITCFRNIMGRSWYLHQMLPQHQGRCRRPAATSRRLV